MATLTAIVVSLALLHAASGDQPPGDQLYRSKALDIIGKDIINDVFRVYAAYVKTTSPPKIPDLIRKWNNQDLYKGGIQVNATKGSLEGELQLDKSGEAKLEYDSKQNMITGVFPVTFRNLTITFNNVAIQLGTASSVGQITTSPKTNIFEITMTVRHKPASGNERCVVTLEKATTIALKGFKTTTKGFGETISKDMAKHVQVLFSPKILGPYIDQAIKQYAAQTAPKVFRYCKYVDFATLTNK